MRPPSAFSGDESGVAAIEFALITPLLILVLFGLVEFPRAFGIDQALARSARTMADLISRGSTNDVADVYAAGNAVTYPYDVSSSSIILTAVGVYDKGGGVLESRVCSSIAKNATSRPVNQVIGPPPPASATKGARYVMAELSFAFAPLLNLFPVLSGRTFSKTVPWPTRGTGTNTNVEVILPGGKACS